MWKQIGPAARIALFFTILTGFAYPGIVTALCQLILPNQANGSLVSAGGHVVGSSLLGQNFAKPEYFHPRPSAAGNGYDATASSGTNLGPTSAKLLHGTTKTDDKKNEVVDFDGINLRIVHYCVENGIPYESSVPLDQFRDSHGDLDDAKLIKAFNDDKAPLLFTAKAPIPADAVTASGSGLDPDISLASAETQTLRVAKARGVTLDEVAELVRQYTEGRTLGFLGEPRVNVLALNLELDRRFPRK